MTEEEYFRKNYPNSCYGDKPLSPHWDFFQDGVEFGERQSEKRIEELEATNKNISNECHKLVDSLEKKQNEVAELEKENESLENVKNIYIGDLLKAKEIIKKLRGLYFSPVVTNDDLKQQDEILAEAEQFISEGKKGMTENSNVPECPSIKIGCDKMYYVDEVEK